MESVGDHIVIVRRQKGMSISIFFKSRLIAMDQVAPSKIGDPPSSDRPKSN